MHCGINLKMKHADGTFGAENIYLKTQRSSNQCTFRIYPNSVRSYCRISVLPLGSEYYWHRGKRMFGMTHRYFMPRSTLLTFHVSRFVQL